MRLVWIGLGLLALILIPYFLWEERVTALSASLLESHRLAWWLGPAIAGLLAADVLLPVPSSVLSAASGALLGLPMGAAVNMIGMTAGCWVGYEMGRPAGRNLLKDGEVARIERLWARYGDWTLVLLRGVPVLAEASVLFAGMAGVSRRRFYTMTTAANAAIGTAYAIAGAMMGWKW